MTIISRPPTHTKSQPYWPVCVAAVECHHEDFVNADDNPSLKIKQIILILWTSLLTMLQQAKTVTTRMRREAIFWSPF